MLTGLIVGIDPDTVYAIERPSAQNAGKPMDRIRVGEWPASFTIWPCYGSELSDEGVIASCDRLIEALTAIKGLAEERIAARKVEAA